MKIGNDEFCVKVWQNEICIFSFFIVEIISKNKSVKLLHKYLKYFLYFNSRPYNTHIDYYCQSPTGKKEDI